MNSILERATPLNAQRRGNMKRRYIAKKHTEQRTLAEHVDEVGRGRVGV